MKSILLFLFFLSLTEFASASGDSRLEFSVKEARIVKSFPSETQWSLKEAKMDTVYPSQVSVSLELRNLTDDTLTFLTNSCNHPSLFSIEDDRIYVPDEGDCFNNKTIFLRLLPRQSYRGTIGFISLRSDAKFLPSKIKVNLVEPKEKYNLIKAIKEKNKKQFSLWTDYNQLK